MKIWTNQSLRTKQVFNIDCVDLNILELHIRDQNAELIVRRSSDQYSFKSFKVSSINEIVIETRDRLRRCFLDSVVMISQDRIANASFLESLTRLLAKLDVETSEKALPITTKAHTKIIETRNTTHSRFVTEMLINILRAIEQSLDVHRIYKHTRDDVLWKNALKSWRRFSLWLFLRVALQTSLMRKDDEESHMQYKSFILFFLTHVLKDVLKASLSSDVLFVMTAEISRRALKLEAVNEMLWLQYVEMTMSAVQQELIRRWHSMKKNSNLLRTQRNWLSSQLSFLHDTQLTLSKLRSYLMKVSSRSTSSSVYQHFTSNCDCRVSQCSSTLPKLNLLTKMKENQVSLYLADLKLWVRDSLSDWLRAYMKHKDACTTLSEIIDIYTSTASFAYTDMSEDISLMLLISMNLWVALDKCALHHCDLLRDYDSKFSSSLFEPLLLSKKPQMKRLYHVEQYLATRRKAAISKFLFIFRSVDTTKSFAVRYFHESSHHQKLRRKIEAKAKNERSQKIFELAKKRQRYHELIKRSDEISCQYVSRWRNDRQISDHSDFCQKCRLQSKIRELTVDVHEWSLSKKDLKMKIMIFELNMSIVVFIWRNITYSILVDMLSFELDAQTSRRGKDKGKQQEVYFLRSYVDLQKFVKAKTDRLQLASTTKFFVISHYRYKKISQINEINVYINNGLNYTLFDSKKTRWTEELLDCCDVREKCTLKLSAEPYRELQYIVKNTIHISNEMIASQAECSNVLTMHEFYAFETLRSDHRLQWRNIARELIARVLNFNCHETHILIIQTAWQVDSFSKKEICQESHINLEEKKFEKSLLLTLKNVVETIKDNWQSAAATRTFVALTTWLLSLSICNMIHESCFRFLRRAREISLRWTCELRQKLQREQKKKQKILNARALEMILICHETFDVDLHHLFNLLKSDEDIAVVTECSIIVHDRCSIATDDLSASVKTLLQRHWRLSYVLEPLLRKRIVKVRNDLDSTVDRLWARYMSEILWIALKTLSERWLVTETSSKDDRSSMLIHYNVLNESLLVNESSLTRLSRSYESHSTFHRLFDEIK